MNELSELLFEIGPLCIQAISGKMEYLVTCTSSAFVDLQENIAVVQENLGVASGKNFGTTYLQHSMKR